MLFDSAEFDAYTACSYILGHWGCDDGGELSTLSSCHERIVQCEDVL